MSRFSRLDSVTLESYRRPYSSLLSISPTVADVTIIAHLQLVKNNMWFEQFHLKSGICIDILREPQQLICSHN